MEFRITKVDLNGIEDLRALFLQERSFQFICNKCHLYGWADTYLFTAGGMKIGYGAVWGTDKRADRDTIFEFYIIRPYHKSCGLIFARLQQLSGAVYIESQSNDFLLTSMLYEYSDKIRAESILFEDQFETDYTSPDIIFRKVNDADRMEHDDSDYVLVKNNEILASGGLMLNYNLPYADVYMQVKQPFRGQGLGCLMVQQLKKEAYRTGRVPAARCNINNRVSRSTLLKAGFRICGYRLKGEIISAGA